MRRLTTFTFAAALAVGSIGCETATNTNVNKTVMNSNGNVAVVVNNNSNMAVNTGMNTNKVVMNSNMSRADYDKDRAKYEAEKGTSTIGQGANDSWIWFKTKGALATTDDLRDSTINVDVANDVVTLRGTVATKAESDKAASVAKGIEGVKSVTNSLKVQAGDSMTNQMVNGNSSTKATNAAANK
jgi:osmotically-inducible protein OsmY